MKPEGFADGLKTHKDRQFVDYIVSACATGVDIGYKGPRSSRISKNWSSCQKFSPAVKSAIDKDVLARRKLGPFTRPPCPNFMGSPMGAFEKRRSPGKYRIIHDLSWPPGHSVNDSIDPADYSMHYMSVDNVVDQVCALGRNSRLAKLDLADAFHHIRVRPEDWELLGSTWTDECGNTAYYLSTVLPFGLRSSPKLFNDFAEAAQLTMKYQGASYVAHYLDDFITAGPPDSPECQSNLEVMLTVCDKVGFAVNPTKVVHSCTKLEFLGIVIDTEKMELRISKERLQEIAADLKKWESRRRGKKRKLLSLIGKLSFISRVVRTGRSFLRRLIETAKSAKHLHHFVQLTAEFHADVHWWSTFLHEWNGVSMFPEPQWTSSVDMEMYTDASDTALAGYYQGDWFVELTDTSQSINYREMRALVLAAATWGHRWSNRRIMFHCDNQAVVHILTSGTSKNVLLMRLVRSLLYIAATHNFHYQARYINTKDNTAADALSRLDFARFWQLQPDANIQMANTRAIPLGHNTPGRPENKHL